MKRLITMSFAMVLLFGISLGNAAPQKTAPAPAKDLPSPTKGMTEPALSGKVVETMNAGGYTYISIEKNGKKTWVAVPETGVKVGQQISFQPGNEMKGFASKSLGRTFDSIVFSGGVANAGSGGKSAASPGNHAGGKAATTKSAEKISVEKAQGPNAYTVGEIFALRSKLDKKPVVLKAKVVKVSSGIMGKNWIHLQDGTGDAGTGTNNLVVTSQDQPAVGDVVTMKGTVYKDKDFGSGYKYNVIIEQGTVQK